MSRAWRIATWNINSVRLRMESVVRFIDEVAPDILCLQETKVQDHEFPGQPLINAGMKHIHFAGGKSYNGVAILSRKAFTPLPAIAWVGKQDNRHVAVRFETPDGPFDLHNLYIPAGGDIPDREQNDKFGHKLDFLTELADWSNPQSNRRTMILGDFNVAPLEEDVWNHKALLDVVSHTPIEVDHINKIVEKGAWVDAVRQVMPPPAKLYSWWSYRSPDWEKADKGRRLDHIWVGQDLASKVQTARIYKNTRGWDKPSDHVPVIVEIQV